MSRSNWGSLLIPVLELGDSYLGKLEILGKGRVNEKFGGCFILEGRMKWECFIIC